jgi:hypothetical protein
MAKCKRYFWILFVPSIRCENSTVSHFVLDSTRTLPEHSDPTRTERAMAWAKDIMAGIGLLAFITCSFALAGIAQAALS